MHKKYGKLQTTKIHKFYDVVPLNLMLKLNDDMHEINFVCENPFNAILFPHLDGKATFLQRTHNF